jgi:hypothetical protein
MVDRPINEFMSDYRTFGDKTGQQMKHVAIREILGAGVESTTASTGILSSPVVAGP